MMRFRIRRGLRFQASDARHWTLDRFIVSGRIQFLSDEGQIETLTQTELIARWKAHDWQVDPISVQRLQEEGSLRIGRDLASFEPNQVAQAEARYATIQPFVDDIHVTDEELLDRARELTERGEKVSARTLRRWLAAYRVARDKTALIDAPRACQKLRSRTAEKLFDQALNDIFLAKERPSRTRVFMELGRLIEQHNRASPHDRVRPPARSSFFRRMQQLNVVVADRERLGRFESNRKHRTALKHSDARCILDRIELDHTQLDIILIDGRTGQVLGRPWLTVAIDVYSRLIFGIYLTFDPPSSDSVLQCLKFGILPKDHLREKFPDLKNDWPAIGLFKTVVFDNGLDAHGGRVRYFCEEIGSSVQYCPSRSPWYKGTIERFFRTLNEGLLHTIPGTTFSNPKQRAGYASEKHCQMDKAEFLHVLVRWIVDVYHVTTHSETHMPPLERWRQDAATQSVDMPLKPADLDLLTARRISRRLHHYGVEIDRIKYNSPELQDLNRSQGSGARNAPAVDVRYHDETVEYVEVYDARSQTFLRVPAIDTEYTAGLDRHTHLTITHKLTREFGRDYRSEDRRNALADIRQVVQEAGQKKKLLTHRAKRAVETVKSSLTPVRVPCVIDADAELPEIKPLAITHVVLSDDYSENSNGH